MDTIIEAAYPLNFRDEDAKILGDHLQHHHSVELIGMKRVGISNFLRFFLFHTGIKEQHMPLNGSHFFILIDLNDLIEREIFPFWRLAFKRITDAVEESDIHAEIKKKIANLFVSSIQSGDLFLTYDGVREALALLAKSSIYPVLFLSRFDRLKEAVTPEFFDNLQGLKDATNHKLSYVFTSFRELDVLAPAVFAHKELSMFVKTLYIQPAKENDSKSIFDSFASRYHLELTPSLVNKIIHISGGHVQYLQFALVILHELGEKRLNLSDDELIDLISQDERIALQSEELWESLSSEEKEVLFGCLKGEVNSDEEQKALYVWNAGFIKEGGSNELFSPLFSQFVKQKQAHPDAENGQIELSKKEHKLFQVLQEKPNEISEREDIVEKVWPEYKEYGVSDWSIDRLVARLRGKLKKQNALFEIQTVRTRGYKLITK